MTDKLPAAIREHIYYKTQTGFSSLPTWNYPPIEGFQVQREFHAHVNTGRTVANGLEVDIKKTMHVPY